MNDLRTNHELSDRELDRVAGGLNPQPLPPGAALSLHAINPQPLPPEHSGLVIHSYF